MWVSLKFSLLSTGMASSSPSPVFAALFSMVLFLGSGIGGAWLGRHMAPGSVVANLLGFLMLPMAFLVGMQLWMGAAILAWLVRLVFRRPRPPSTIMASMPREGAGETRSGAWVFVVVCPLFTLPAGLVTGWLSESYRILPVLGLYAAVGLLFGIAVWQLAKRGYIDLLEEA